MKEALIRIHARICGDGSITVYETSEKDRNRRGEVKYTNLDSKNIEEFREDMQEVFNVRTTAYNNRAKVKSIRIVRELQELGEFKSSNWRIPEKFFDLSEDKKIEWLRAFIRDEGHYAKSRNALRIKSMNKKGLEDTRKMLESVGVESHITGPNYDESYYLNVTKLEEYPRVHKIAKNKPKVRS